MCHADLVWEQVSVRALPSCPSRLQTSNRAARVRRSKRQESSYSPSRIRSCGGLIGRSSLMLLKAISCPFSVCSSTLRSNCSLACLAASAFGSDSIERFLLFFATHPPLGRQLERRAITHFSCFELCSRGPLHLSQCPLNRFQFSIIDTPHFGGYLVDFRL